MIGLKKKSLVIFCLLFLVMMSSSAYAKVTSFNDAFKGNKNYAWYNHAGGRYQTQDANSLDFSFNDKETGLAGIFFADREMLGNGSFVQETVLKDIDATINVSGIVQTRIALNVEDYYGVSLGHIALAVAKQDGDVTDSNEPVYSLEAKMWIDGGNTVGYTFLLEPFTSDPKEFRSYFELTINGEGDWQLDISYDCNGRDKTKIISITDESMAAVNPGNEVDLSSESIRYRPEVTLFNPVFGNTGTVSLDNWSMNVKKKN